MSKDDLTGAALIAAERERQISVEGWSAAHDAQYTDQELPKAAMCYALGHGPCHDDEEPPHPWPWPAEWWKPTTPIRDLAKAGALIAAEIDRRLAVGEQP